MLVRGSWEGRGRRRRRARPWSEVKAYFQEKYSKDGTGAAGESADL